MCVEVLIGGMICSTPRQLAAHIGGGDRIEWLERHGEMDWCLCVVNIPATLKRASKKSAQDETGRYVIER